MGKKVLIVDDEKNIVDIVAFNLHKEGYDVAAAYDGERGLALALDENTPPDLVLLDIMMPKMDGFEVCRRIRAKSQVPIIMLSARVEEADKLFGLDTGADDYVTKPFSMKELLARINANTRRAVVAAEDENIIKSGNLKICLSRFDVQKDGVSVQLTHKEFELLKFLALRRGEIFSRSTLLQNVWEYEYITEDDARNVDVTIRRLRAKIEDDPANPSFILTKRNVGYYFKA